MDVQPLRPGAPGPRQGPRRRDRRGRGRRWDLIPPHLPGYRSRRERFDDLVAGAGAALVDRRPRAIRCEVGAALGALGRPVLSEQIGALLGIAPEDVDPEAWAA